MSLYVCWSTNIHPFVTTNGRLESIKPRSILEGHEQSIMGLIWTLIKEFEIKSLLKALPPQQGPAKDQFLEWVRSKCAPRGITVNNWTTDFQDGRVFLAIINDLRPDLVPDWGAVNGLNPRANLSQAFDLAEDEMDIPQMLDVDDVIRFADDKSIQAYCAEFLNYEQKNTKLIKSLKGALSQAAVPDPRLAQQKADLEARERAMQEQQRKHAELLAQQQQATLALEKMRLDQQKRMLELEQQKQALAAQQAQHAQLRAQQEALQRAHQQASMEKMQRDEILRAQNQAAAEAQLRAQQEQFNQQRLAYEQHVYQQKMLEQQQQQAAAYHHQQQQYAMMQRNLSMPPPGQIVGGPMMGMPIYAAPPPQQAGNIEVIIKGSNSNSGGGGATIIAPGTPQGEPWAEVKCKKCSQVTQYKNSVAKVGRIRCRGCSAVLIKKGQFRQK